MNAVMVVIAVAIAVALLVIPLIIAVALHTKFNYVVDLVDVEDNVLLNKVYTRKVNKYSNRPRQTHYYVDISHKENHYSSVRVDEDTYKKLKGISDQYVYCSFTIFVHKRTGVVVQNFKLLG